MRLHIRLIRALANSAVLLFAMGAYGADFVDVLDTPACMSSLASMAPINALARAGERVVAVGQRGHILYTDNDGKHWRQAPVPVSTDLTAVFFASARLGWAVGHDGVILHSADGGATWVRQLDGRAIGALVGKEHASDTPLLDVWFADERRGFAVGAFNLILHTTDGGASWQSWMERTDNPKGLHLNAIGAVGADLYIAGEQGLLLKRSSDGQRFTGVATPYQGSYFGVTGDAGKVVVFGLRGNAFGSTDAGRSWTRIDTGIRVGLTASAVLPDGRLALVSQAGHVLLGGEDGKFRLSRQAPAGPAAAVVPVARRGLLLGGVRGVRAAPLDKH